MNGAALSQSHISTRTPASIDPELGRNAAAFPASLEGKSAGNGHKNMREGGQT
jgi:hypothetical protein